MESRGLFVFFLKYDAFWHLIFLLLFYYYIALKHNYLGNSERGMRLSYEDVNQKWPFWKFLDIIISNLKM